MLVVPCYGTVDRRLTMGGSFTIVLMKDCDRYALDVARSHEER